MINVFIKKSAEELQVQLSDGRMMPFEDLVRDYERLLKQESSKKEIASEPEDDDKAIASELKDDNKAIKQELCPGVWFRIDREIIKVNKNEIRNKCNEAGTKGKRLLARFEESNKIADENRSQYPRLIETYIVNHNLPYVNERQIRNMCKEIGGEVCDEVICDLELQMRICNGEPVANLVDKPDRLYEFRFIQFRNGDTGFFGGCSNDRYCKLPAAWIQTGGVRPYYETHATAYAFRRV